MFAEFRKQPPDNTNSRPRRVVRSLAGLAGGFATMLLVTTTGTAWMSGPALLIGVGAFVLLSVATGGGPRL